MLAGIFGKILSWLAGKGFLMFIQEALKAVQEERIRRDYEEALKENAVYDALARDRAGADATRGRIRNVEMATDLAAVRDRLRARDPNAR